MTAEVHVLTGDRAGLVVGLSGSECTAGRHAECTLCFTMDGVSLHHARFVRGPTGWILHDLDSTNHTWLNGRRLRRATALRDGDRIVLGPGGPLLEIRIAGAVPTARGSRAARPRLLLRTGIAAAAACAGAAVAALQRPHADVSASPPRADVSPAARAGEHPQPVPLRAATPPPVPIDLAPRRARPGSRVSSAAEARPTAPAAVVPPAIPRPAPDADEVISHGPIRREGNRQAVARIWAEGADGRVSVGTAFAVRESGILVTSRHVVQPDGGDPRRVAIQFAGSTQVWRARVVAASPAWDLAVVQVDGIEGGVPAVRGINLRPDTLAPGAGVSLWGFPRGGAALPGAPAQPLRSTAAFGAFRTGRVEVHARSAAGASGSPLFDADGMLLGVLFGGDPRAPRPVLYAVPAAAVLRLADDAP